MILTVKSMTVSARRQIKPRLATVSAGYARTLVEFAAGRGAAPASLLAHAGIEERHIADVDARVPLPRMVALFEAARSICGDPAFALHFGEDARLYSQSIVGLIIHASSTMGEAFEQYNRYARLVVDFGCGDGLMAVKREREKIHIVAQWRSADFPDLAEASFARMASDHRRTFSDETPFIKEVSFRRAAVADRADYDRIFRAPIQFGADRDAMLIDPSWLTAAPPTANALAKSIFSDRADHMMVALPHAGTVRERVEAIAHEVMHKGEIGMALIAQRLGISESSLRRRLKEEGVSFRRVIDDARCKAATRYLTIENVSVGECAFLVGFSDPPAFSRAYKRWTGKSPASARPTTGR